MTSRSKFASLGLALAATAAFSTAAFAEPRSPVDAIPSWERPHLAVDAERPYPRPRSPVDSYKPGGGYGGYGGCAVARIHNAYRLTICDDGRYTVRGAGLSCSGSYNWWGTFGGVRINLRRSPCGSGTDWSGDTIRCGGFGWGRRDLIDKISYGSCTYFPTREAMAEGYGPERVTFR